MVEGVQQGPVLVETFFITPVSRLPSPLCSTRPTASLPRWQRTRTKPNSLSLGSQRKRLRR